jgi:hypothetical protein
MKKIFLLLAVASFVLTLVQQAYAAPMLNFSDLVKGGRTGLTDGSVANQGAIVTIWGNNLGSTQGTSKVYVGSDSGGWTEAAYVYTWVNANGSNGGPSDLYSRQKMQEISFAISSSTATGSQKIKVTVGGVDSNQLDFEVTSSGNFYFVKSTGNNSNTGTWASPWLTPQKCVDSMGTGGTCYIGTMTITASPAVSMNTQGASGNYKALIAYPNSSVVLDGGQTQSINTYCYSINGSAAYWVYSKFLLKQDGGRELGPYERFIGNACTESSAFAAGSGWITASAANNDIGGWAIYGNYMYNIGSRSGMSNQSHVTYFSHRYWNTVPVAMKAFDFGWNHLKNNYARFGIHFYDEGSHASGQGRGQYETGTKIHENVVEDQDGYCLDFNAGGGDDLFVLNDIYVYNNLFINCGLNRGGASGGQGAIYFYHDVSVTAHLWNNTIYGWGLNNTSSMLTLESFDTGGGHNWNIDWLNNIVQDVNNQSFFTQGSYTPNLPYIHSNNLWYSSFGQTIPSWDTSPMTSDPLFWNTSPQIRDFRLQSTPIMSPAIKAGVGTTIRKDMLGVIRPAAPSIGAFDFDSGAPIPKAPVLKP